MGKTGWCADGSALAEELLAVLHGSMHGCKDIYGSYVHGLFDKGGVASAIVTALAEKKGIRLENGAFTDYQTFKETQYDKLADTLRSYLNMEEIYGMLREARLE